MKNQPFYLLAVWLLFLAYSSAPLQVWSNVNTGQLPFQRFSIQQGLSQSSIIALIKGADGNLWLGTQDGLNRFDGHKFKIYKHEADNPNTLVDNSIWSLANDKGKIWIGTENGLSLFDLATESFKNYQHDASNENSLSSNRVSKVFISQQGQVWIGTRGGGLNRFVAETETFIHYRYDPSDPGSIAGDYIDTITEDHQGNIWLGMQGPDQNVSALVRFNPKEEKFYRFNRESSKSRGLGFSRVRTLYFDLQRHFLWIGPQEGGLYRYNLKTDKVIEFMLNEEFPTSHLTKVVVRTIEKEGEHGLWIGTRSSGLLYLNQKSGVFTSYIHSSTDPISISDKFVQTILQDKDQLWVGTWNEGLNRLNLSSRQFSWIRHDPNAPDSFPEFSTGNITEDSSGNLWVAANQQGLVYWDTANRKSTVFTQFEGTGEDWTQHNVSLVFMDSQQRLWVGTEHNGLYSLDWQNKDFHHYAFNANDPNGIGGNWISTIIEHPPGTLWIGVEGKSLDRFDIENNQFTHYRHDPNNENSLSSTHFNLGSLFVDAQKNLWIGSINSGVNRLDIDSGVITRFEYQPDRPSISHNMVTDIAQDPTGAIWLTTQGGGLNKLQWQDGQLSFSHFSSKKYNLDSDLLDGLLIDNTGIIWISIGQSITRFDPVSEQFIRYGLFDGPSLTGYSNGANSVGHDGHFYFGGAQGILHFDPSEVVTLLTDPKVILTDFYLNNRPVKVSQNENAVLKQSIHSSSSLVLDHRQNNFGFAFSALDYQEPIRDQYAYRMYGFDDQWIMTSADHDRATYTNLEAGSYQFQVKARNNNGVWNEETAQINISILSAPWRSWWAYLIYICLVVALAVYIYHFQHNRIALEKQQTLNRELLKLDKLKDSFLANTTHELRTPLNGIIGISESLLEGALDKEAKEKISLVIASGKRLAGLINDILDYSKIESGLLEIAHKPVDLYSVVKAVFSILSVLSHNKPVKMINAIDKNMPMVLGDENRLQQIFLNLIGNAIKYTDHGFICVSGLVKVKTIQVIVKDSGLGIREEDQESIFELFSQSRSDDQREITGTGIGLAITKQLIELHGSTIHVSSKIGQGSKFNFDLTLTNKKIHHKSSQVEPHNVQPRQLVDKKAFTILSVDDNPVNLIVVNAILKKTYNVIEAKHGEEAIQILNKPNNIDLVLLDVMMPVISGFEVCKKIRLIDSYHQLPIIFITASSADEDIQQGMLVGGNEFIEKPIRKQQLLDVVKKYLIN